MTQQLGMANIPINPYEDENPTSPTTITGALSVVDYNPGKSYVVFGDATKTYKENLKGLGGKFNSRLHEKPGFPGGAAWIFFDTKMKVKVLTFSELVNKVNDRGGQPQGIPEQGDIAYDDIARLVLLM